MVQKALNALQKELGYEFSDRSLLVHALIHSSRKSDLQISNERLEFLGDAILGTIISEYLFREFVDYTEGELTRIKSAVVSRASLARVGRKLNLGRYLMVAKGVARLPREVLEKGEVEPPTEPGQEKRVPASLLSNAFEAIIGAVYLDSDPKAARDFVMQHLEPQIERACANAHCHNYKSTLQQLTQRKMACVPTYEVTAEEGPDHGKSFSVMTMINGECYASGSGRTKKAAEQEAAQKTLLMMGHLTVEDDDDEDETAP